MFKIKIQRPSLVILLNTALLSFLLILAFLIGCSPYVVAQEDTTAPTNVDLINRGIYLYDPNGQACIINDSSTDGTLPILEGENNAEKIWTYFISKGLTAEQTAGIMGNLHEESVFNPDAENDIGAYGIAQWLNDRRDVLEETAAEAGVPVNDLAFQLQFLYNELQTRTPRPNSGYIGTSELAVIKSITGDEAIKNVTVFFHYTFERSEQTEEEVLLYRFEDPDDGALFWYNTFNDPLSLNVLPSYCDYETSLSLAGGDIIETAKLFAWDYQTDGLPYNWQAREAYQTAAAKYFPIRYDTELADCTYFVATVMRESGVDPDFPVGTIAINNYLRASSGQGYTIIENPTRDQLQPGDILQHTEGGCSSLGCWSGHILIYAGDSISGTNTSGMDFVAMDASKYTRVPGYLTEYSISSMLSKSSTIVARKN